MFFLPTSCFCTLRKWEQRPCLSRILTHMRKYGSLLYMREKGEKRRKVSEVIWTTVVWSPLPATDDFSAAGNAAAAVAAAAAATNRL